jgi:nicotinamide-nucleotide amidase
LWVKKVIATACERSRLLIFTGGLGPTPDDLTTATLADFFDVPLVEHPEVVADIAAKFARLGRQMAPSNRKQALLPYGANVLKNTLGTAPGMIWQPLPELTILTFPGVPAELHRMWTEVAVPYFHQRQWVQTTIQSQMLKFWGIPESTLAEKVADFLTLQNPTVAPYANIGEVKLRVAAQAPTAAEAQALIQPVAEQLQAIAGIDYFGSDHDTLASVVGNLLQQTQTTLGVAESCTGGGVGQALTDIPGSSDYFWGGVIAYDNRVKLQLLQVDAQTLATQGAVSAAVAEQMAQGIQKALGVGWGLSITGIAGPSGGSDDKPVGLVYIGVAHPNGSVTSSKHRFGDRGREIIRRLSVSTALDQLRRQLLVGYQP